MSFPLLAEILALLSLIVWFVLAFLWGSFWRVWDADADRTDTPSLKDWPRVAAVIPARNEAASIAAVVAAMANQDYPGEFSVIVVDDHSDDGTRDLARTAAMRSGASDRVRIISAPALASGWTGKLWALNSGVAAAVSSLPQFLWFTDADVVHAPNARQSTSPRSWCFSSPARLPNAF